MNSREIYTQALLNCHQILMRGANLNAPPGDINPGDGLRNVDAEKIADAAYDYALALTLEWQHAMQLFEQADEEDSGQNSVEDLTEPEFV